jgi:hypothetical protein
MATISVKWERTISVAQYEPERFAIAYEETIEDVTPQAVKNACDIMLEAIAMSGDERVEARLKDLGRGKTDSAPAPTSPDPYLS